MDRLQADFAIVAYSFDGWKQFPSHSPDLASKCAASYYTYIKQFIFGENTRPFAQGKALAHVNLIAFPVHPEDDE